MVDKLIRRAERLPSLPEVISKILELSQDPESTASELAALVEKDEGLVFEFLRLVNAPAYGLAGKVSSIRAAVTLLGFGTVRSLALSVYVFKSLGGANAKAAVRFLRFWQHALAVATAARLLASRLKWKNADEAFTAGLIHDLGKLIFLQHDPDLFAAVSEQARLNDVDLTVAEEERYGISHPALGRMIAERWNLPRPLLSAIQYHHSAEQAKSHGAEGAENPALCVCAANTLAKLSLMGEGGNDHRFQMDPIAMEALQLKPDDLPALCVRVAQESIRSYGMFNLRTEVRTRLMIPLQPDEPAARSCLRVALMGGNGQQWDPLILTLRAFGHIVETWDRLPTEVEESLRPHVVVTSQIDAIPSLTALRQEDWNEYPGVVALVPADVPPEELRSMEEASVHPVSQPYALVDLVDAILGSYLEATG